jgi:membrane associated rhomboid family serine protease
MISPPIRPAREPIFNVPGIVLASILLMAAIHAIRMVALSDFEDFQLLVDWAVVPVRWTAAFGGIRPEEIFAAISGSTGEPEPTLQLELARYVLAEGNGRIWTGLTHALLHGSWTHLVINGIWLAAFGTPVARRCGNARFLLLFVVAAFGGALAHVLTHPYQALPLVGASAAVSGMMAAAAWFMFAPAVWLLEGRPAEPHERPREAFSDLVRNRRVLIFLGVWLLANYLSAVLAQPLGITEASIAWEAHIGGFVVGLLLFPAIDPIAPHAVRAPA